ncbi:PREDICTED: uncharacterized protein LOC108366178 [Rhagoletis zephyria]|uniref:uncharacterized protein LOC108366178 n=1 Tax=Rhagoletis zephyria TaxID=28612 RepID=UPI0008116F96|nr:PREDICTED: uncharacterized protein LOC108366178 [Rhagoletis zephyria]
MFEMDTGPNERNTLLAKNLRARKYVQTGSISSVEQSSDMASDVSVTSAAESADFEGSVESMTSITSSDLDEFNWRRLRFYLVEPMVFILLFAYNLSDTILKNQIIYQTCTAIFYFNETDCRQLGTKNASEHIQAKDLQIITQMLEFKSLPRLRFAIGDCGHCMCASEKVQKNWKHFQQIYDIGMGSELILGYNLWKKKNLSEEDLKDVEVGDLFKEENEYLTKFAENRC